MLVNAYRYAMAFYRKDGHSLGQIPVPVDWEPSVECVRFSGIRRGHTLNGAEASIEPLWHAKAPAIEGFRVTVSMDTEDISMTFPLT